MSYRKARIPIRTKDGIEYRDGYKFDACFSNGEFFEIGVYKVTRGLWIIRDLNTGLMITSGKTRINAVERFLYRHLSKLERLVLHNADNLYSKRTAEFQAMLKESAK